RKSKQALEPVNRAVPKPELEAKITGKLRDDGTLKSWLARGFPLPRSNRGEGVRALIRFHQRERRTAVLSKDDVQGRQRPAPPQHPRVRRTAAIVPLDAQRYPPRNDEIGGPDDELPGRDVDGVTIVPVVIGALVAGGARRCAI